MGFDRAINDIKRLENEEFNFNSFKFAGVISRELGRTLINEVMSGKEYAEHNYDLLHQHLLEVVYSKLKETLDFEDETIVRMLDLLKYSERLVDIYVLDGNVIAKVLSLAGPVPKEVTYVCLNNDLCELTSVGFNNISKETIVRDLIVGILNTAIKPLIRGNIENIDPVGLDGIEIIHLLPEIEIYFSKSLKEIEKLYSENSQEVVKVLVKIGTEEFYTFDLKNRDGCMILSQNEYEIQKVSELMDQKQLVKE